MVPIFALPTIQQFSELEKFVISLSVTPLCVVYRSAKFTFFFFFFGRVLEHFLKISQMCIVLCFFTACSQLASILLKSWKGIVTFICGIFEIRF